MYKVRILAKCLDWNSEAYLPIEECEDRQGRMYTRYAPCPTCDASGKQSQWIDLEDFAKLLHQADCPHKHTSYQGNLHFSGGDTPSAEAIVS